MDCGGRSALQESLEGEDRRSSLIRKQREGKTWSSVRVYIICISKSGTSLL